MLKLSDPNISEEAIVKVANILRSGQLVHGAENEALERELEQFLGCKNVMLVSSGTAALHIAILTLGIGEGDAVIVPDFTFPATANVVVMAGARPVIVDVNERTYNLCPLNLRKTIENWDGPEQLRAVLPVHEFGRPAQMDEIMQVAQDNGLAIIEDAACALGAKFKGDHVGTFGDLGCFSFHPRKTITTGEGGAIATNDDAVANRIRRLRNQGMMRSKNHMHFLEPGLNYRMTNFQAALGRSQLPSLNQWIETRKNLAYAYHAQLQSLESANQIVLPPLTEGHSWQTFMIVLNDTFDRDLIIKQLREKGIETNLGAQSLSSIGLYGRPKIAPIVGPRLYDKGLALPFFERLASNELKWICDSLIQVLRH